MKESMQIPSQLGHKSCERQGYNNHRVPCENRASTPPLRISSLLQIRGTDDVEFIDHGVFYPMASDLMWVEKDERE
jgi:hypothetical protein